MSRSRISRFLALLGVGGVAMACNTGGETIDNPFPDADQEPNDTVDTASVLVGAGTVTVTGECHTPTDVDHFSKVSGTSGNATAAIDADVPLASVALLTSSGSVLITTSAGGPYQVTVAVDSANGVVILRLTCDGATGAYSGTMETP